MTCPQASKHDSPRSHKRRCAGSARQNHSTSGLHSVKSLAELWRAMFLMLSNAEGRLLYSLRVSKGLKQASRKDFSEFSWNIPNISKSVNPEMLMCSIQSDFRKVSFSAKSYKSHHQETVEVAGPWGFRAFFVLLAPRFPKIEKWISFLGEIMKIIFTTTQFSVHIGIKASAGGKIEAFDSIRGIFRLLLTSWNQFLREIDERRHALGL